VRCSGSGSSAINFVSRAHELASVSTCAEAVSLGRLATSAATSPSISDTSARNAPRSLADSSGNDSFTEHVLSSRQLRSKRRSRCSARAGQRHVQVRSVPARLHGNDTLTGATSKRQMLGHYTTP
jgi:hypothetical protein